MKPLVSVLVPTFNRPRELEEALGSVALQKFRDFEVVVVDDGETNVEGVVDRFRNAMDVRLLRHGSNRGAPAARNSGIRAARGKYIAYLDDDDLYYPEHLKVLVDFLEGSNFKAAYTDALRHVVRPQGDRPVTVRKELFHGVDFDYDAILIANFLAPISVIHEKDCLEEVGYWDETLSLHQDLDLWIRMSRKYEFAHIPGVTAEFREKAGSPSITKNSGLLRRIENLQAIHWRYRHFASPRVLELQKAVIARMREDLAPDLAPGSRPVSPTPTDSPEARKPAMNSDAGDMPSEVAPVKVTVKDSSHVILMPKEEHFRVEGIFSRGEYAVPHRRSRKGPPVVADVGANVGVYATYVKMMHPQSVVHCFEPSPRSLALLRRNTAALNGVFVHETALSDRDGEAFLNLHEDNSGEDSLRLRGSKYRRQVKVPLRHAGHLFDELKLDVLDILKVDTEGCELEILRALGPRLHGIDYILLEYHSESDRKRIDSLLSGFSLFSSKVQFPGTGIINYMNNRLLS